MSGPFNIQPTPIFMDIPTHKKLSSLNIFLILFDYLARKVVVLENLFSSCLLGVNLISFGRCKWKEINIHFPLCLSPKWCSALGCIYFLYSDRGGSFLLFPASSYFWHPWYVGRFKGLSSAFFVLHQWEKKSHSRSVSSSFFHSLPPQAQTEEGRNTW